MAQELSEQNEAWWGARINGAWRHGTKDWPAWADPVQQRKWTDQGLVLWDHRCHIVTRLSATQALRLLEELRGADDWQETGMMVGEPTVRLFIGEPKQEPEHVLLDQMALDPGQSQALFNLLVQSETQLRRMSEAEEEECDRVLADAYRFLLELAHRRRQRQQSDAPHGDS